MNKNNKLVLKVAICIIMILLSSCKLKPNRDNWAMLNTGQDICGTKGMVGVDIGADNTSLKWKSKKIKIALVDSPIVIGSNDALNKIIYNGIHSGASISHSLSVAGIISTNSDSKYKSVLKDAPIYCISVNLPDIDIKSLIFELKTAEKRGIRIVNMSFTLDSFCQELYDYISNSKMLFVCAAGNDHTNDVYYPAGYNLDNVISVIGINNLGYCSTYSNYSIHADIAAPGENILCICENNNLNYLSGTSFATPYVTASAAYLIDSISCNAATAKKIIISCARKMDSLCGYVSGGRLLSLENIICYIESHCKK